MIYESRSEPLVPRAVFLRRLRRHGTLAFGILLFSLAVGMVGFHWLCGQAWIDAFLNATMLLGGMGPVGTFEGTAGKIFAGVYALYAGVVFLAGSTLVLAPIMHRLLHRWHLESRSR